MLLHYHPGQGRWISPDSVIPDVFNPQTFNAYHYAFNRPTSTIDPFGLHEINGCLGCVDDNFGNPNAVTYVINGMQVSAAAFNGAILGQGGSGLEFAFAPGSGIGPATSGTMGELGNWSFVPQYGEATTVSFGDDTLSTANYVHGTWQFSVANNGFTVQLGVAVNWNFWGPLAGSLFSGVTID